MIYEALLLFVLFVIFCLLHGSHPAGWGLGITVVFTQHLFEGCL